MSEMLIAETFSKLRVPAVAAALMLILAPAGPGAAPAVAAGPGSFEPIELPASPGYDVFPYTLEVPKGWRVQTDAETPGLWIGPPGTHPESHQRLVYARFSPVSLAEPAGVEASIEASAAEAADWRAPVVEVRDFGGVSGVWVEMERGEGGEGRTTLVVKLPLGETSVDFLATASKDRLDELRPLFERILLSLRPVADETAAQQ